MYRTLIKPFFDFVFALILFAVLLPVFVLVMLLLSLGLKGTPFFLQKRPGKNERIFTIIKFRTMNNKRDDTGELLPDSERMVGIGKVVRSTSLDEIPQLLNVIMGDMSLVGPRPLLPEYLELYNDFQSQRHNVKPGITGYAQVNGRNTLSWEKKFELDIYYIKNISFVLDVSILIKTVVKVFRREGINNTESPTMGRFKGTIKR